MGAVVVSDPMRVLTFVRRYMHVAAAEGMKGIGLERDGELTAGVLYEGFNGRSMWMHVAANPGGRWLTREFLRYCFHYPFVEAGVDRVFGWVDAANAAARRFDEHLGFKPVAVIPGASRTGGEVVVYAMNKSECRYVDPQ